MPHLVQNLDEIDERGAFNLRKAWEELGQDFFGLFAELRVGHVHKSLYVVHGEVGDARIALLGFFGGLASVAFLLVPDAINSALRFLAQAIASCNARAFS
jgi:hypothetical protein